MTYFWTYKTCYGILHAEIFLRYPSFEVFNTRHRGLSKANAIRCVPPIGYASCFLTVHRWSDFLCVLCVFVILFLSKILHPDKGAKLCQTYPGEPGKTMCLWMVLVEGFALVIHDNLITVESIGKVFCLPFFQQGVIFRTNKKGNTIDDKG